MLKPRLQSIKGWFKECLRQYKRVSDLLHDKPDIVLRLETPMIIILKRLFIRDLNHKFQGIKQSLDFIWLVKNFLFSRNKKMRDSLSHDNIVDIRSVIKEITVL